MDSLTELYETALVPLDAELEKQAEVLEKQAEEEDAAGRIMARGFADELTKLSAPFSRRKAPPPVIEQPKDMAPGESFAPGDTITPGGGGIKKKHEVKMPKDVLKTKPAPPAPAPPPVPPPPRPAQGAQ